MPGLADLLAAAIGGGAGQQGLMQQMPQPQNLPPWAPSEVLQQGPVLPPMAPSPGMMQPMAQPQQPPGIPPWMNLLQQGSGR